MPILEFACNECSHQFETIIQGGQTASCPSCESDNLARLISVFAVGGRRASLAASEPPGPCGSCGDPRGPGACAME